jgi:hypothetical protein
MTPILGILASAWRLVIPQFISIAYNGTPYISVHPWSAGFGTKYANPATLPPSNGQSVAFNPDGTAIAVAHPI